MRGSLHRTAALLLLMAGTARGTQVVGPVEVIALSQRTELWRFGYVEHRLQVRNLDAARAHVVTVSIPAETHGGGGIERIARTVELHPADTAVLSLPQPARALRGRSHARIAVRGAGSGTVLLPSLESSFHTYQRNRVPVYMSRGVDSDRLEQTLNAGFEVPTAATGHPHQRAVTAFPTRAEMEIAAWSPNWLGYTCYAGVFLTAAEWQAAAPAVRDALLRYAAAGGVLVSIGEIVPPTRWALAPSASDALPGWVPGVGRVLALPPQESPGGRDREDLYRPLAAALTAAAGRWDTESDVGTMHARFPVIERLSIPVAGIFYLLLGFAILAGPVLLIVLARKKRRIWLMWIAPLVSVLAGALVVTYALLSDGVTPTRRADTLTLLDQVRQQGVLVGLAGYYAPLTPRGGLRFAAETAIAAYEPRHFRHHGSQPAWRLDLTRDQHFVAGFVQANVPLVLQVRKPFATRERIDVHPAADGGLEALNGLAADILSLRLRASDGRWFEGGPLASGQRGVLRLAADAPGTAASAADAVAAVTSATAWADALAALTPDALLLEPGTYAAELARNPFLEPGLDGRIHNRERSLLIGRFAE